MESNRNQTFFLFGLISIITTLVGALVLIGILWFRRGRGNTERDVEKAENKEEKEDIRGYDAGVLYMYVRVSVIIVPVSSMLYQHLIQIRAKKLQLLKAAGSRYCMQRCCDFFTYDK